ncbi:MAG: gamma-glutamylcyclotransferase [Candidatus Obscuribacterales bacterium]|nr:gamma-glutamylcyclotransferase [Candidatus Obscuribacterales bacterium]
MLKFVWVFAYGSNMNVSRLQNRLREKGYNPDVISDPVCAILPDHRLIWNYYSAVAWKAGAANIEYSAGAELPGVAFKTTELAGIDAQEGHPKSYVRKSVRFKLAHGEEVEGYVYSVNPQKIKPAPVWPKPEYFDLMIAGAKAYGLPESHIALLESYKTQAQTRLA